MCRWYLWPPLYSSKMTYWTASIIRSIWNSSLKFTTNTIERYPIIMTYMAPMLHSIAMWSWSPKAWANISNSITWTPFRCLLRPCAMMFNMMGLITGTIWWLSRYYIRCMVKVRSRKTITLLRHYVYLKIMSIISCKGNSYVRKSRLLKSESLNLSYSLIWRRWTI